MHAFASYLIILHQIGTIGKSVQGRELWYLRITEGPCEH